MRGAFFLRKKMNLEKYVDAFCFSNVYISESSDVIFYLWQKEGSKQLYSLESNKSSLSEGTLILEHDFSVGSFYIDHYDQPRNFLYLILDISNKENFNLWKLDLTTKKLTQLTFFDYTAGTTFNKGNTLCWCFSKIKNADGTFHSEAYEIDLLSQKMTFLFSDRGLDYRVGWSQLVKIPGRDQFVFTVDYLSQRKKTNICRYTLTDATWENLLPLELEQSGNPSLVDEYPSTEGVLIESVHEGFQNIYFQSFDKKTPLKKMTDLHTKNEGISIVNQTIRSVVKLENQFTIMIDTPDGNSQKIKIPGAVMLYKTIKDFWGILSCPDSPNKIVKFGFDGQILKSIEMTSTPSSEFENTISSWVEYPSFDGKMIKSMLHLPKTELKAVCLMAFYGGEEWYSSQIQRYAEMGIAVLSPAVRGSWGWGREWEKMLEGDLGGDEILDVIWGGKYLEAKFGLPASKIGVFGGSHGGYATLRAITMPKNYKGLKDTYFPFGFAISSVGMADLVAFYNDSRIADWLVHLLGPFDKEFYLSRSPITFFDNLETPLLIINGKNDSRVPFSTMESFIMKLKESNKSYELLIHEGQGHGASNRSTRLLEYQTEFNFLKRFI